MMEKAKQSNVIANNSNIVLVKVQQLQDVERSSNNVKKARKNLCRRSSDKLSSDHSNNRISFFRLFRFATAKDLIYLIIAIIASLILGLTIPLSMVIFGDSIDSFTDRTLDLCSLNLTAISQLNCPPGVQLTPNNFYQTIPMCDLTGSNLQITPYDLTARVRTQIIYSVIIGCVALVCGYIRTLFFNLLSERQSRIIRQALFHSILHKDIEFFDRYTTGELNICLTDSVNKIQDGIGNKFGTAVEIISTLISCLVIGFVRGWKLTLVVLSMLPVIFLAIILSSKMISKMVSKELKAYGKAGSVAEEVISGIRTVFSYNGQNREIERYEKNLDDAKKSGIRKSAVDGATNGFILLLIYSIFALGFWYGAKLVREENYTIGNVFTVFMGIYMGVLSLEQASPFFQAITQAQVAANIIWRIIDEPRKINLKSEQRLQPTSLSGDIRFSKVRFAYPSRPDVNILNGLTFRIRRGETVAIVGASGSGKSTCVQLLQRFYDYQSGSIELDGVDLRQYDLQWLREQIGVVSQEPILFQTTIRENIRFGCPTATDTDLHQAARIANAHEFIMNLPNKYETIVGERGASLSGGQKQRIAIARALVRNPKILLLDEATSALDNQSEKVVQEALERASQGRTTIIIAHRLSTIRYANQIIVLAKGRVVEKGTHESLMKRQGAYANLIKQQNASHLEEKLATESTKPQLDVVGPRKNRSYSVISVASTILNAFSLKRKSIVVEPIETNQSSSTWKILKLNKPEWLFVLIGCLAAFINGALEPTSAIVQTKLVTAFQECDQNAQERQVRLCSFIYIGFGLCGLVAQSLQIFMFACSGEALTKRLRSQTFRSILRQDLSYFDAPEHNTGVLCTCLATEASAVQGASGVRLGIMLQNSVTIGAGIFIGFLFSWQLTLLIIAFLPLIVFGAVIQIRLIARFAKKDAEGYEQAGKIVVESIQNIRTVVQLSKEEYFYEEYSKLLDDIYRSSKNRVHVLSSLYAISSSVFFFAMAALISLGATLVNQNIITFEDFFMVFDSVALTARIASQTLTLSPDYGKALKASEQIFSIIERQSKIDNCSTDGETLTNFHGNLKFEHVQFSYPNRSEAMILNNFQLDINSGQKIALVGASGCGKSTIVQLIERFYDPDQGRLLVDSKDVRSLNLQWYRSQIGVVSQEPILFDLSIRENISYGDNNRKEIPFEEIIQAAKNANIHEFIRSLPDGYETNCGAKGIRLSGGQKQRIAIARALLRNPKVLLFDEATSALDAESEQIVQEALDRAQENRTSITIAHRLSTIEKADLIYVLDNGLIVESGRHEELMAQAGRYSQLRLGRERK